jgi:hypothetical protein
VPPVALLPLVVIMPPVEVVVHSVAMLPLAAVVPRRRAARRRRVSVLCNQILDSMALLGGSSVQYCVAVRVQTFPL